MEVNPDLQKERDGASFDTVKLTYELYWGEATTKKKRLIGKWLNNVIELHICCILEFINININPSHARGKKIDAGTNMETIPYIIKNYLK